MPTQTNTEPRTTRPRVTSTLVAALATALALLVMAIPASATSDNQGTIKVHNPDSLGDESNDPHVGCSFYVEGFNMEATSGTLVIDQHPPTGSANVVDTTWTANDVQGDAFADHHFLNGPFSLPAGHYKVFVSDTHHDKMKTFWVDGCEQSSSSSSTTPSSSTSSTTAETSSTTSDTTTTTHVPVFPTPVTAGIGIAGALGGTLLMLRRRL